MATKFALNANGIRYRVKLVDCLTGTNRDVSDVTDQFIRFYRPDGTSFDKQATKVEDPPSSGIFFINYLNTDPEASILDQVGDWEYSGVVTLSTGDIFESAERKVIWVK